MPASLEGGRDALTAGEERVDAADVGVRLQDLRHVLLRVGFVPAVRAGGHDLSAAVREDLLDAGHRQVVQRHAGETFEDRDLLVVAELVDEPLRTDGSGVGPVRRDRVDVVVVVGAAVGDDRDARRLRLRDGRVRAGGGCRVEQDRVDPVGDEVLDRGVLLRRIVVVGADDLEFDLVLVLGTSRERLQRSQAHLAPGLAAERLLEADDELAIALIARCGIARRGGRAPAHERSP